MRIIPPVVNMELLPEGATYVVFAKDQPQYLKLPAIKTPDGKVMSAWKPSYEEINDLLKGGCIYLTVHTGNMALQPVKVSVGQPDLRDEL